MSFPIQNGDFPLAMLNKQMAPVFGKKNPRNSSSPFGSQGFDEHSHVIFVGFEMEFLITLNTMPSIYLYLYLCIKYIYIYIYLFVYLF